MDLEGEQVGVDRQQCAGGEGDIKDLEDDDDAQRDNLPPTRVRTAPVSKASFSRDP